MDQHAKRVALRMIPHGVFVAGVKDGGQLNAFTVTWLTQASFEPPRVAMGVRRGSQSLAMIERGRVFAISVLGKEHTHLAEHFVKPVQQFGDKLGSAAYATGATGAPILTDAIAFFECRVIEIANGDGDHAMVVGEVVDAGLRRDSPALTLADTGWHYGG